MTTTMRVAGLDCGTNSLRLLVADISCDGEETTLTDVYRRMEVVRLGQDVDKTGRLADEALARTFGVIDEYAQICADLQVQALRFVATSASRDAENRDVFVAGVRERLGVEPEVISGDEEAALSFAGAASGVGSSQPDPQLIVDVGGGSTEFILGVEGAFTHEYSANMGCVRVKERFLAEDGAGEAAARAWVRLILDEVQQRVPLAQAKTLIGLAGTVVTVTAHALEMTSYDPELIDGARVPIPLVLQSCQTLIDETPAERLRYGFMHPGRADVIGAGAVVWSEIVQRVQELAAEEGTAIDFVVASEHDILDGIALSIFDRASAA